MHTPAVPLKLPPSGSALSTRLIRLIRLKNAPGGNRSSGSVNPYALTRQLREGSTDPFSVVSRFRKTGRSSFRLGSYSTGKQFRQLTPTAVSLHGLFSVLSSSKPF